MSHQELRHRAGAGGVSVAPIKTPSESFLNVPGIAKSPGGAALTQDVSMNLPFDTGTTEKHTRAEVTETVERIYGDREHERLSNKKSLAQEVLDISAVLADGVEAIVDDTFWCCFQETPSDPWNWNIYLFPLWVLGVAVRYLVLFPLRALALFTGWIIFCSAFAPVHLLLRGPTRLEWEAYLVRFFCNCFVASWNGVIRFHGPAPISRENHVWVANHTSMIDYIVLCSFRPFAVIMQKYPGWIGFLQTQFLDSIGCIWFNRTEMKDRLLVQARMRKHVRTEGNVPLLIFPEGTCVNNEYIVMFKKGAFDLGATVCPIAIKYNKVFVDAFWNSRRLSFSMHLVNLMTSWAVVCDVYFMEPQTRKPGESSADFANRVQHLIAERAGLRAVPWDGMLKYYRPSGALVERRRQAFADVMKPQLEEGKGAGAAAGAAGDGGSDGDT